MQRLLKECIISDEVLQSRDTSICIRGYARNSVPLRFLNIHEFNSTRSDENPDLK